jgi:hypothetical protein
MFRVQRRANWSAPTPSPAASTVGRRVSERNADQNELDYGAFTEAVGSEQLEAVEGV